MSQRASRAEKSDLNYSVAGTFISLAIVLVGSGGLLMTWFAQTTESSGALWWATTREVPLDERLPRLFVALGLFVAGVVAIVLSIRLFGRQRRLRRYVAILTGVETMKIQQIASISGQSPSRVRGDVQRLIDSGVLTDFYIDSGQESVVRTNYRPVPIYRVAITCSACGGPNEVVVGTVSPCAYCSQPVVGTAG